MHEKGDDGGKGAKPHAKAEGAAVQQAHDEVEAQISADEGLDGGEHGRHSTT